MAYKTGPRGKLTVSSRIGWQDEDGDMVTTTEIFQAGLTISWSRARVQLFYNSLKQGKPLDGYKEIIHLVDSDEITILRAPQLKAHFILGHHVKEFMTMTRMLREMREKDNKSKDESTPLTDYLGPSKAHYEKLEETYDYLIGYSLYLDEIDVIKKPLNIHYLFLEKNLKKN